MTPVVQSSTVESVDVAAVVVVVVSSDRNQKYFELSLLLD